MSELAGAITQLPQVMINVKDVDKAAARTHEGVLAAVAAEEAALGDTGRVLLRASGTEPLVRVMVEAPTQELAQGCAQRLADVVREHLALSS